MNNNVLQFVSNNSRCTSRQFDAAERIHWSFMHDFSDLKDTVRPCFHPRLMSELRTHQLDIIDIEASPERQRKPTFFVLASRAQVFNLGGDLELFAEHISSASRSALLAYARMCVEGVHAYHQGFGPHVHSVALVQGAALGGGFEAALACNTIIAEEQATFGLPEVIFGLFPGMGAYPFLRRRAGGRVAEQLIMSGKVYSARELHDMGVIDRIVPDGTGEAAVRQFVRESHRCPQTRMAMDSMRRLGEPVSLEELYRITEAWVDAALMLEEKSLKIMRRFASAQERKHVPSEAAELVRQAM